MGYENKVNEKGERLIWLDLLLARQLTRSTVLSAQISTLDTSAELTVGVFPAQIHATILALRYFGLVHWPAFSVPSTFFQLAEPLPTTWSSTRSALRQFVTFTVTVSPAECLGLGLHERGSGWRRLRVLSERRGRDNAEQRRPVGRDRPR